MPPKFISFNPGPSQLYPEIEEDIQQALDENILSLSHRSEKFGKVIRKTQKKLHAYFSIPHAYRIYFVSSAVECMDIALRGCCAGRSFHFVNGAFARRFLSSAQQMKKSAVREIIQDGRGFSFERLEIPAGCDLVCLTQNETSTGVRLPYGGIQKIRQFFPDKTVAVDIVSSAATEPVPFDSADLWFFSVQKACGLPAGLGVLIVSERAVEKARRLEAQNRDVGSHHSLLSLEEFGQKNQTPATPNMLAIYLLGKRFKRLIKVGIETVEKETKEKAKMLYDWLDGHSVLKPFVKDPTDRSFTVVPIVLPKGLSSKHVQEALKPYNIAVGYGYGTFKECQIRIANFPQHSKEDIDRVTKAIDEILQIK